LPVVDHMDEQRIAKHAVPIRRGLPRRDQPVLT
jgi:hypothetical protein